ncbi:uncharacterized protein ACNLHF_024398 [Anomaloglossus baeobatrachus]
MQAGHSPISLMSLQSLEIPGACSIGQSARSNVPGLPLGGAGGPLMPLVRASKASSTWTAYGCSRPSVWVLGHSCLLGWAEGRVDGGRSAMGNMCRESGGITPTLPVVNFRSCDLTLPKWWS